MSWFLGLHIFGGMLAVVSGFTALFAGKGSTLHRRSGQVFLGAMLLMGLSGSAIGFVKEQAGNVVFGLFAVYMAATAFTTVRPISRRLDIGLMVLGFALGAASMTWGMETLLAGRMSKNGVPVFMTLAIALTLLFAATGDLKLIRKGPLRGSKRIVRHLWRMCISLWIASGSFFTIRKRVAMILPDPFLGLPIRMLPVILPLLAIGYWIWRIKFRKSFKPVRLRQTAEGSRPEAA